MSNRCIYCDQEGPFSDEHMFPAGLGGDDRNFLLKDLVCASCNTEVFSRLEAQLMRNSPYAYSRLLHQPMGRGRGKKARPPEFTPELALMTDPDSGVTSEVEMLPGGIPEPLPQIQILDTKIRVGGPPGERISRFLLDLVERLHDAVFVVEKKGASKRGRFETTEYKWVAERYEKVNESISEKAPSTAVWLLPLHLKENDERGWPRIFQRKKDGQLNMRLASAADAPLFLSQLRKNLPELLPIPIPEDGVINKPDVRISMRVAMQEVFRAIAKIGVNTACIEYGDKFIRSESFVRVREAILRGTHHVDVLPPRVSFENVFGQETSAVHLAILFPSRIAQDRECLVFAIRLYGAGLQCVILADDVSFPPNSHPVAFVIHYRENRIERLGFEDYLHRILNPHDSIGN